MLQTSAGSDGPQCYNRITCLEKSRLENMEQVRRHRMLLSLQHVCHLQFCSTPFHVVVSAGAVREHAAGGPRGGGWAGGVDCAARRVRRQLEGQRRLLCVVWPKSREGGVDDGRLRQRRRWRRRRWRRWRRRRRRKWEWAREWEWEGDERAGFYEVRGVRAVNGERAAAASGALCSAGVKKCEALSVAIPNAKW